MRDRDKAKIARDSYRKVSPMCHCPNCDHWKWREVGTATQRWCPFRKEEIESDGICDIWEVAKP